MILIAELCQNHNGCVDTLWAMLDNAVQSGATHVKIQHIYTDDLVFRSQFESKDPIQNYTDFSSSSFVNDICLYRPWQAEYQRLKKLEISNSVVSQFVERCHQLQVVPLTTCFSKHRVDQIVDQGFTSIKVASYDCASYSMLRELAKKFTHLFVSTGASHDKEVTHAAKILESQNCEFSLLHCTTIYPTPPSLCNLQRIKWLQSLSKQVGYSDHTNSSKIGIYATLYAIYLGASIIERHFSILDPSETKDGPVSISPSQLSEIKAFSLLSRNDQYQTLLELDKNNYIQDMVSESSSELSKEEIRNRLYYRGRFASPRLNSNTQTLDHPLPESHFMYNWEEV